MDLYNIKGRITIFCKSLCRNKSRHVFNFLFCYQISNDLHDAARLDHDTFHNRQEARDAVNPHEGEG